MRSGEEKRGSTPFAQWLRLARKRRGLTQEALADAAGVHFTYISKIELGQKVPLRDVVVQLAAALVANDANDHTAHVLLNEGLTAAGYVPFADGQDEHEVIDYLRGKPAPMLDKAYRMLRAAFDEDDTQDNAGNTGKKSE